MRSCEFLNLQSFFFCITLALSIHLSSTTLQLWNMFIHTDEPELAFNLVRIELGNSKFYVHRAAYRKLEGNSYEMLYPEDCSDRFRRLSIASLV